MLTHAQVKIDGSTATLTLREKELVLRVVSLKGATLQIVAADPPHAYDTPNPDSRLVTFETKLALGEAQTIVVDFLPDKGGGGVAPVAPLISWQRTPMLDAATKE